MRRVAHRAPSFGDDSPHVVAGRGRMRGMKRPATIPGMLWHLVRLRVRARHVVLPSLGLCRRGFPRCATSR
jgi:hypothetical protein